MTSCNVPFQLQGRGEMFGFFFWLINMMSFHVPNHIQVVSKSAFFVWNLLIQTKKPNKQKRDAQFLSPGAFNTARSSSWPGGSRAACRWCSEQPRKQIGSRLLCAANGLPVTFVSGTCNTKQFFVVTNTSGLLPHPSEQPTAGSGLGFQ